MKHIVEAAKRRLKENANVSTLTFYRGIAGVHDLNFQKKQNIIWLTPNKDYASEYADSDENIRQYKVLAKSPFDFGFRTLGVHVKMSDMVERIKTSIMGQYEKNKLSRDKTIKLMDDLDNLENSYSSQMKRVWEWWDKEKKLADILRSARFDAIKAKEGTNNDTLTYGVLYPKLVKLIK